MLFSSDIPTEYRIVEKRTTSQPSVFYVEGCIRHWWGGRYWDRLRQYVVYDVWVDCEYKSREAAQASIDRQRAQYGETTIIHIVS